MSLELDFTIDAVALSLDEECTYSQLMDMEIDFEESLDMELEVKESILKDHSVLSEDSRNLPDQHIIGAITNLSTILEALREAIRTGAGATLTIQAYPVPQDIQLIETEITFAEYLESTDTNIMDFVDNHIYVKKSGRYFFASNINVTKSIAAARTLYLYVRDMNTGELVSPYPRTIELGMGVGTFVIPTQTIIVDLLAPAVLSLRVSVSGTGCSFSLLETNFYTAMGGGSGLWHQDSAGASLLFPTAIDMQDESLINVDDVEVNDLEEEETYTSSIWTYLVGLFTSVPKSVKGHVVEQWNRIFDLNTRLTSIENKVLFETVITEDTARIDITGLNISSGVPLKFLIWGTGYESQSANLRINDINTANYHYNVSTIYGYFVLLTYPTRFFNDFSFVLHAGNIIGNLIYARELTGTLTGGIIQQSTFGLDLSKIETISVIRAGTSTFKAGTHIKLLKA